MQYTIRKCYYWKKKTKKNGEKGKVFYHPIKCSTSFLMFFNLHTLLCLNVHWHIQDIDSLTEKMTIMGTNDSDSDSLQHPETIAAIKV